MLFDRFDHKKGSVSLYTVLHLVCHHGSHLYSKSSSSAHSLIYVPSSIQPLPFCVYRDNSLALCRRLKLTNQLSQRAQHDRLSFSNLFQLVSLFFELRSDIIIQKALTFVSILYALEVRRLVTRISPLQSQKCLRYCARFLEQRALVRGGFLLHFKYDLICLNRNLSSSVRRSCAQSLTLLAPRST